MKLNLRYHIEIVIVEIKPDGSYGDVYDNLSKFRKEKPNSSYRYGYIVVDRKTGFVPPECNDWNDSIEEAIFDYEDNCNDNHHYLMQRADEAVSFIEFREKCGYELTKTNLDIYLLTRKSDGKVFEFVDEFKTSDGTHFVYELEEYNSPII